MIYYSLSLYFNIYCNWFYSATNRCQISAINPVQRGWKFSQMIAQTVSKFVKKDVYLHY